MDKLKIFPKENHEKRQLQEIAHLYFSDPAPAVEAEKEHKVPKRRVKSVEAFSPFPRALFVHCAADGQEGALSTWFLFNLALMLKILGGPVLLIGSERAYEKRFLFGFRPDRERLRPRAGPSTPLGAFGPMGVCLLDSRTLCRGCGEGRGGVALGGPMAERQVAFRYILSDEVQSGGLFRSLPELLLLLVTPATTSPGLLDRVLSEEGGFLQGTGHVGIVIAGASCTEEADALYGYWRGRVEERYEGAPTVENFGVLPAEIMPCPLIAGTDGDRRFPVYDRSRDAEMSGMGILEDPAGPRTRFCQSAAALVRRKHAEMLPGG